MADDTSQKNSPVKPSDAMRALDRLVGTWQLSGDTTGKATYEWMEGGFFLLQHLDMTVFGHRVQALEVIGHRRPFGQEPSADIHSQVYDTEGNTLDYVYELEGDTLTIWGGQKGSTSYFKGKFIDADTNEGEWFYPGGGYKSTMKRVQAK